MLAIAALVFGVILLVVLPLAIIAGVLFVVYAAWIALWTIATARWRVTTLGGEGRRNVRVRGDHDAGTGSGGDA